MATDPTTSPMPESMRELFKSSTVRYRFEDGDWVAFPEAWLIGYIRGARVLDRERSYAQLVEDAAWAYVKEQERETSTR